MSNLYPHDWNVTEIVEQHWNTHLSRKKTKSSQLKNGQISVRVILEGWFQDDKHEQDELKFMEECVPAIKQDIQKKYPNATKISVRAGKTTGWGDHNACMFVKFLPN